ncbi:adenosylcobinamide amidohydrolase [Natrinema thermotolerans]|uniref:Adenosylcobinamide amidohydrolase n=1 Tax=Natrinema thermotolerans TaxID=121872 RepID=A0AAF0T137_9EURY|nr:adenosylcobinamide amidohydrolase [Natrinema thermotolerans]QCC59821.1 adenosylcobinamide amidohydrolase [Natrinema thermotolerans]WMT06812.1 adenosylcobinamide amidohydrolase [Natrinema thermotolerans]
MSDPDPAYGAIRRDGVLRVGRPATEWLSTGPNGGRQTADHAYNISVPEGWERTDLAAYVGERLERAGFDPAGTMRRGPALLTGVDIDDARGACRGPVTVYATAGISNPAALPIERSREAADRTDGGDADPLAPDEAAQGQGRGTVNVVVGTTRSLAPGALENLIAVAAEAKAATLLAETGFPGTTTDAIVVGHDPEGRPAEFSGSGTEVGAATRACVRDAVRASLRAHYADRDADAPDSVIDATYGVSTDGRAAVFRPPLE